MDIEQLTKAQIVLLTLLVSFVTSIATGIVTVTLLDQAPPAITRNITSIVERTVERVVPAETDGKEVTTSEQTVVVKDTDLITDSIERNAQSLVRVIKKRTTPDTSDTVVGVGVFASRGGLIVTDSTLINEGGSYAVTTDSGEIFNTVIQDTGEGKPTALLRVTQGEDPVLFTPITFSKDIAVLKLGQTVISLSGGERTNVSIGIIASLDATASEESGTRLTRIRTDLSERPLLFGSPLIDIFGEVIGIYTASALSTEGMANFIPITAVQVQVAQFIEPATE